MAKLEEKITKRRLRWLGHETGGDNNKEQREEKTQMIRTCTQHGWKPNHKTNFDMVTTYGNIGNEADQGKTGRQMGIA